MKQKKDLPTVTIGIPAYNEAQNITNMLASIQKQKQNKYRLETIWVVCDCCTDKTVAKVRQFAKKLPQIKLIEGKTRKGKAQRLNQLYRLNTSDILVTLDADIVLAEPEVLDKLVTGFTSKDVLVVGANNQPVPAKTLTERIYNAGYRMWYEMRQDFKGGHNINNFHGMTIGLRREFARSFKQPNSAGDGPYICLTALQQNKRFRFIRNAIVLFHSVDNWHDFFIQSARMLQADKNMAQDFGNLFFREHTIPFRYKMAGLVKSFFVDPIFTPLAVIQQVILRLYANHTEPKTTNGIWQLAQSSKKRIKVEWNFV